MAESPSIEIIRKSSIWTNESEHGVWVVGVVGLLEPFAVAVGNDVAEGVDFVGRKTQFWLRDLWLRSLDLGLGSGTSIWALGSRRKPK